MKTLLVTGCGTGFGKSIVDKLSHDENLQIIATVKDEISLNLWPHKKNVQVVKMDITSKADLKSFEQFIQTKKINFDAVLLNAGISNWGPLLDIDETKLEDVINVNLIGTLAVLRRVMPHLAMKAKVLCVGSTSRLTTVPFMGIYPITKAALHMVMDRVRAESSLLIPKQKIQFAMIDPGSVVTEIWELAREVKFSTTTDENKFVRALGLKVIDEEIKKSPGPEVMADLVLKLINKKKLARCYYVGQGVLLLRLLSFLPNAVSENLLKLLFTVLHMKHKKTARI